MSLPIAGFGNVTSEDAAKLTDCLRDAASAWPSPTVQLAGGGALEFADDRSVWARLDGDVDALVAVARGVVETVAMRGFFVDRRKFKPWLAVATITDTTTASHLEEVVAALDAFRGTPWAVEWVTITKPSFDPARGGSMDAHRIPLATA
jgi:2'-5' RNA ligase